MLIKKSTIIKIILTVAVLIISAVVIPRVYTYTSIRNAEKVVIEMFKEQVPYASIINTRRSIGDGENFYLYIEYRQSNTTYINEYLCQKSNGKWNYNFIKTTALSNANN